MASILVAISDMRWFTTACTPSSMLSEPKARTFCTSSARMVSSSAMCGTTSERALRLLVVFWIAGAPRAVVSTRLRLPSRSSIITEVVETPCSRNRPSWPIRPGT